MGCLRFCCTNGLRYAHTLYGDLSRLELGGCHGAPARRLDHGSGTGDSLCLLEKVEDDNA